MPVPYLVELEVAEALAVTLAVTLTGSTEYLHTLKDFFPLASSRQSL